MDDQYKHQFEQLNEQTQALEKIKAGFQGLSEEMNDQNLMLEQDFKRQMALIII